MKLIKELLKTGDYTLRQDASKVWGLYNKDGRKVGGRISAKTAKEIREASKCLN